MAPSSRTSPTRYRKDDERPSGSGTQTQSNLQSGRSTSDSTTEFETVQTHFSQQRGTTILPTALVHVEHLNENFTIRALLDAGSESSFITKRLQQNLALPLEAHNSQISGLGGTVVGNSKGKCCVTIKSRQSDFRVKIKAIVVPKLAHFLPSKPIRIHNLPEIKGLCLADPYFFKPSAIDMIIGSDYFPYINLAGVKLNVGNCLEARESYFGWYLSGPEPVSESTSFHTIVSNSEDLVLHEQLRKFWELEEAEKSDIETESDVYCENFFQQTTTRQSDGRYIVRLPFKKIFPTEIFLGPSRNMALAQYHRMETTLDKSPDLKDQYMKVLQEYLDLHHMEPVVYYEPKIEKHSSFFLPHHAVIKPESKTTKVRVVFNASKKTGSGFSLNDCLYQGPTLQKDLIQIMLRWRNYKYVFTGDIQKMYRQILIHEDDRSYQRILFRNKTDGYVNSFKLNTVTFGVNSAPFLAIRTLLELSKDCKSLYPMASAILENEVYVDDILSGGHTLEEVKLKQSELTKALESAKFPLKKMTANDQSLLKDLPREDLLDEDFLKLDASSTIKTLGIRWNAITDSFYYVVDTIEVTPSTTKRRILSVIARLFNPLGWLGPIVIIAKILMQELWEEKSDWDEGVSPLILTQWNSFLKNLPFVTNIKIPRWIGFSPQYRIEIHGFCDASEKAYCGSVYIRTESSEGQIDSNLLVAKTKVAPIKRTTIPKLELCGALLLAKLIRNLGANCQFTYELFLWTDSSIVLGWLQKPPNTYKTFVANRVAQIVNIASTHHWKHVKTEENPADIGTRGCSPQELADKELWWHGPTWLKLSKSLRPIPRTFDPTDLEVKNTTTFHLEVKCIDLLEEFSSFERALRVLCYRIRFINRILKKSFSTEKFITLDEISSMKIRLISIAQRTYFGEDYNRLKENKSLSRKSRLLSLSPFIDNDDLLRVGGRLGNSGLSYGERHPIIVPERSHLAKLLVHFTHRILLHSEHHIMLRAIRQGYYIPRVKNLIRKCIRECKACTIYKHKFQQQIMVALPPERVNFSLPFTYTGVDFAGPFSIKSSKLKKC
ncbi:uncharacterized protein LOC135949392 [Calliphora vicina]|uniref:uncharacterized protein LOC135949392 n=1 Tax=Calliphora vicina TaxID=7373 RepID=UPI00325BFD95